MRILFVGVVAIGVVAHAAAPHPACWPSDAGGTGTRMLAATLASGGYVSWWCPPPASGGAWTLTNIAVPAGYQLRHPATLPADLAARAAAYWDANVGAEGTMPADPLALAAAYAVRPPDVIPPPPPEWIVASNTMGWQIPYAVTAAGGLGTMVNVTIKSGSACDCVARQLLFPPLTYCRPAGRTDDVVVPCVRK